jgi:hypothetical protein
MHPSIPFSRITIQVDPKVKARIRRHSRSRIMGTSSCVTIIAMGWLSASLILQVILAVYFQAVLWFPLGRWNDQPGKRLIEMVNDGQALPAVGFAILMALPVLLFALAYAKRCLWLMWLAVVGYGAWATMQIQSWWVPWVVGADERALNNQKALERTYKLFPASSTHPAPDSMHFVLDLLLFSVVITLLLGLLSRSACTVDKRSGHQFE